MTARWVSPRALGFLNDLVRTRRLFIGVCQRLVIGNAPLIAKQAQQTELFGTLLFSQQVDLQIEMIAPLAEQTLTVLAHQNHRRRECGLKREDEIQEDDG